MKEIKFFLFEQSYARKRVVLSRAQTCSSYNLGECPNHLDHLHYMLCPCLNSSLRAYYLQNLTGKILLFQKMAREISRVCDFIFGSLCTCIPTDTVDIELTVRMVKGIYTYCKDDTAESTVFSLWSKSVIPFPSLR